MTYLSVDLDYWGAAPYAQGVTKFLTRVRNLKLPIFCAVHHHHILEHVNENPCDCLVNTDWHSDLSNDDPSLLLNCGTWANYVEWANDAHFEWRHPQAKVGKYNYCHGDKNPFEEPCTPWRKVTKRQGLRNLPWSDIKAIGLCVSPDYVDNRVYIEPAIRLLNLYEIIGREWADPESRQTCLNTSNVS